MPRPLIDRAALAAGYERLHANARLLDRINVFPVPDGDTGRNLVLSLAPLRRPDLDGGTLIRTLLTTARGNSGNIAARFMEGLLDEQGGTTLAQRVKTGLHLARTAVADPRPGTMLSLFEALADGLAGLPAQADDGLPGTWPALVFRMEQTVRDSVEVLPTLRKAGVVDAGALGMFVLMDGYLCHAAGVPDQVREVTACFADHVQRAVVSVDEEPGCEGFCVDAVLRAEHLDEKDLKDLADSGESAVTIRQGHLVKVHLHTDDREGLTERLSGLGHIVQLSWDDLGEQARRFARPRLERSPVHLMTDAAGSFSPSLAEELGVTLLSSYVNLGEVSLPEALLEPEALYAAMRRGEAVSTSQASDYERQQHYARVLREEARVLYLCVGSVFTGNVRAATAFKARQDPEDRLRVIDSGAASGRLGIVAQALARRVRSATDLEALMAFAERALAVADEWIFLDKLHWLARGGRLSRPGAFFGDLLHLKPVVSPRPTGAERVGMTRRFEDQLAFAVARLEALFESRPRGEILLQYTDNQALVRERVQTILVQRFPGVEIRLHPMSLTSGAHMGPGTWAVAALPELDG